VSASILNRRAFQLGLAAWSSIALVGVGASILRQGALPSIAIGYEPFLESELAGSDADSARHALAMAEQITRDPAVARRAAGAAGAGSEASALAALEALVEADPGDTEARSRLIEALLASADGARRGEARRHAEALLRTRATPEAYVLMGRVEQEAGDQRAARWYYRRALEDAPDMPQAQLRLMALDAAEAAPR
jgi:tetratricopeptide (TPR) repeat protein